jgi:hypothetical protein
MSPPSLLRDCLLRDALPVMLSQEFLCALSAADPLAVYMPTVSAYPCLVVVEAGPNFVPHALIAGAVKVVDADVLDIYPAGGVSGYNGLFVVDEVHVVPPFHLPSANDSRNTCSLSFGVSGRLVFDRTMC